ncbi:hypothetical protein Tco_0567883 [Tanacetum coccineum]
MASLNHRSNHLYAIKECSSCGNLHTKDCGCPKGRLEDKILTLEEVFQDFQDTSKSSNDDTNFVNQEPFVVKQGPGVNSSQSPPQINHNCCYECGDSLDDIFCQRCTCKSCGKGAHYGYNCPPQIPIISNPEPCYNQNLNEIPQIGKFAQQCLFAIQKKEEEKRIAEEQAAEDRYWKIPICYDDDDDYTIAITPVLPTKEPVNSLSMGDEHLDTIPATESDEVIKSCVENLVPIPSEPEGIPDSVCDVPLCNNPTSLEAFKEHSETIIDSNDDSTSSDDDSYENIDYGMHHLQLMRIVSLECRDVYLKVGWIDTDFIFDLSIDPFPPADRSDFYHEEFADELAHIISPPEYDQFCFKIKPELGNLTMDEVEDIFPTREPRVHVPNVLSTHPNLDTDFISEPLFAYIVWIFLHIFSPVGMKILFLTPASPFIILLCRVYLIGVELS